MLGRSTIVILNLIFIPIFFKYLGPGNFSIIGLYISALALIQALDFGLGTGLSKHVARVKHHVPHGRPLAPSDLQIIYTTEIVYFAIGLTAAIGLIVYGPSFGVVDSIALGSHELVVVFVLFGSSLLFQWMTNFYGNGLIGMDKQGVLNGTRVVIASITSLISFGLVVHFGDSLVSYFCGQAIGLGAGALVSRSLFWRGLSWLKLDKKVPKYRIKVLVPTLHFNLAMAVLGVVSILASQADKLFLISRTTSDQYGFYTIGMQVSNSIGALASCVYSATFSMFAVAVGYKRGSLPQVRIFIFATVLMCLVIVPNSLAIIVMGEDLLNAWLGVSLPESAALGIKLLVGGTMINSLMVIPFVVQIVNSSMRFSIIKNLGILAVSWPILSVLYDLYGVSGVASFWLVQNFVFFLFEPIFVCKRFIGYSTFNWYIYSVIIPISFTAVGGWLIYNDIIVGLDIHAYLKFMLLDCLLFVIMFFGTWILLPQTGFNIKSLILSKEI